MGRGHSVASQGLNGLSAVPTVARLGGPLSEEAFLPTALSSVVVGREAADRLAGVLCKQGTPVSSTPV